MAKLTTNMEAGIRKTEVAASRANVAANNAQQQGTGSYGKSTNKGEGKGGGQYKGAGKGGKEARPRRAHPYYNSGQSNNRWW